jgi:hypothetical protein
MKRNAIIPRGLLVAAVLGTMIAAMEPVAAAGPRPVVVELFTSQGCSSCPPANANLIEISKRPDVLALSFAVTYWDRLGWKDTFGKEEFTARQVTYEPALGERGPFNPQMVVNGRVSTVGNRIEEVEAAIAGVERSTGPEISIADGTVTIGAGDAPLAGVDVWLVRYDPAVVEVPVGRGENGGRTLAHTHVVHDLERLGGWDGMAMSYAVAAVPVGLRTAILVQAAAGGPILAAATD